MAGLALSDAERRLLEELNRRGVRYLVVGMSAALLQGARGLTEDIDLWFERLDDPRIAESVRAAGGLWISGAFGMRPPTIGGPELDDRFDVVTTCHGLDAFAAEYVDAVAMSVDGLELKLLPLERVIASKRAANRDKDRAALPALETALAVQRDSAKDG
jgi:predicted nucleotidyltransferase